MRMIRRAAGVAAVLMLAPAFLVAQTPEQRIERALSQATQVGVPLQLLQSKVAEGRAKGIPMERVAQAVEQRLATLQRVKAAIGERNALTTPELGLAADAAQAGVSETVLAAISERAPRERRAVAIAVLTQLVQLGHASDVALQRVTEALQRGPDALQNLTAGARGRGGPPESAPGQGAGAQNGRGGPPASVPPAGSGGTGRGRGGPPGGD